MGAVGGLISEAGGESDSPGTLASLVDGSMKLGLESDIAGKFASGCRVLFAFRVVIQSAIYSRVCCRRIDLYALRPCLHDVADKV